MANLHKTLPKMVLFDTKIPVTIWSLWLPHDAFAILGKDGEALDAFVSQHHQAGIEAVVQNSGGQTLKIFIFRNFFKDLEK